MTPADHPVRDDATDPGAPVPPSAPVEDQDAKTRAADADRFIAFLCIAGAFIALTLVTWITLPRPPRPPDDKPRITFRVNVNTADPAALQLLPGVGPAMAQKIAAERARRPFTDIADLQRVSGIGAKTAARLAPFVVFDPPPTTPPPPESPPESQPQPQR